MTGDKHSSHLPEDTLRVEESVVLMHADSRAAARLQEGRQGMS